MKIFLSRFFIFLIGLLIGAIITFNTLGLILGNIIYQELSDPKLNINITGIVNHSQDLSQINELEQTLPNAQKITLPSADNQTMTGTFINNNSDKTVILIHGLYQNRSMSIIYTDTYAQLGFNVLLYCASFSRYSKWIAKITSLPFLFPVSYIAEKSSSSDSPWLARSA